MPGIFISYRRKDTAYQAGQIYDRLVQHFGQQVFKDVDSIPLGDNFVRVIGEWIERSAVVLVLIGDAWLAADPGTGQPRLEDPSDFVRREIELALRGQKVVIPVFLGQAQMPAADRLPESIRALAFQNGLRIDPHPHFQKDMEGLIRALEPHVRPAQGRANLPGSDPAAGNQQRAQQPSEGGPSLQRKAKGGREATKRVPAAWTRCWPVLAGVSVLLLTLSGMWASGVFKVRTKDGTIVQKDGTIVNSIGMELVLMPKGTFRMGSPSNEKDRCDDEGPQHEVEITRDFYLGKHEVTRGQFRQFVEATGYQTGAEGDGQGGWGFNKATKQFKGRKPQFNWKNAGFDQTDEHPVGNVTWYDAQAFCEWLSKKEDKEYRLPTEAEWEYCCRAHATTRFHSGDDESGLRRVANIADKSLNSKWDYSTAGNEAFRNVVRDWFNRVSWDDGYPFTAPVGKFEPNAFGLLDMHGNVWEWCQDWYKEDYYKDGPGQDPQGPNAGLFRVVRGGSFDFAPRFCRAAYRSRNDPADRFCSLGFRVVRVR